MWKISLILISALLPSAQANTDFGLALYQSIAKEKGNVFLSPYSISTALAMTSAGAKGKTLAEMRAALQFGPGNYHAEEKALAAALEAEGRKTGGPELAIANRLWGKAGQIYEKDFLALTKANYGAELTPLDYAKDPEAARARINGWVEEQTRNKIQNLIPAGAIKRETDLVLTNAIYFKGRWETAFLKEATRPESFHREDKAPAKVSFMHLSARFLYKEEKEYQAVRLPYRGETTAMVILLPREKNGLAGLERKLSAGFLRDVSPDAPALVDLSLPKFRLELAKTLNSSLQSLGMKCAFDHACANFSGIHPIKLGEAIAIDLVLHKAVVEVDEEGTVAAAATAVLMAPASAVMPEAPKEFKANRPFLFYIEHLPTKTILFLGRVADPAV